MVFNNKLYFIMMVGISGSGKSTEAKNIASEINATVLSSDSLRKTLFGDENFQGNNELVFSTMRESAIANLMSGSSVIYDATSIKIKDRADILDKIKWINCYKIAYVVATPFDVCLARNSSRDRVVPDYVIERQRASFQIPFIEEGFDEIVVKTTDSSSAVSVDFLVDKMNGFNQNTHWHKYDLGTHCSKAFEYVEKNIGDSEFEKKELLCAAKIHDYGKLVSYQVKENGEYSYHNHENIGAYELLSNFKSILYEGENTENFLIKCAFYVNYHMMLIHLETEKSKEKWRKIFGAEKYRNLEILNKADRYATGREE